MPILRQGHHVPTGITGERQVTGEVTSPVALLVSRPPLSQSPRQSRTPRSPIYTPLYSSTHFLTDPGIVSFSHKFVPHVRWIRTGDGDPMA